MKRPEKSPGTILCWAEDRPGTNGLRISIGASIKGVEGFLQYDWDISEPKGPYYAAAKLIAIKRGFDDVEEVGTLKLGKGFIFRPVLNKTNQVENKQ